LIDWSIKTFKVDGFGNFTIGVVSYKIGSYENIALGETAIENANRRTHHIDIIAHLSRARGAG